MDDLGGKKPCPECLEQGTEKEVRHHLIKVHGWTEQEAENHFEEQSLTKVSGVSPPVSERDTSPSYAIDEGTEEEPELQQAENESELCDCDPDYKETAVIQKSTGASFGGFGGNRGNGTPVIICKSCGQQFEATESSEGFGPGYIWDNDDPGLL
ncbi:hypothetical protein B4589_006945 [Halolamina sp. CBA1230]|uniref:hypothetical protein n=1 Tax=Halolamina sp. CBA1230 TaxID=1853690 RepID=UPI001179F538|nr:hypothetical protein [Halolamina sp. CBA1230]QKY20128.1 hypothetical protein B4589_006945 [Halolamina sp. CBA1230]